jgi:hypothetical protein
MKLFNVCALLAATAGFAAINHAMAQDGVWEVPAGMPVHKLVVMGDELVPADADNDPGYSPRFAEVYNSAAAACAVYLPYSNILDDVNFGPIGPWATTTNNSLRTINVPLCNSNTATTSYDFRVSIWDTAAFTASPMIATTATPLFRASYAVRNLASGLYTVTFTPANPVICPDNQIYVQLEFFNPGSTTVLAPIITGNPARTYGVNRITTGPGSSTVEWGLDTSNNDILAGGALNTTERRSSTFTTGTCANQNVNLPIIITGDIPVTAPSATSLGNIVDAAAPRTDALTAGQVKWYTFTLTGDISDTALTYLDIDTEGSNFNTAMALYSSTGNVRASDQAGGSGDNSQLSFGIGRRAGNGDGEQFDGYDGELLAADGPFYLAVCQGDATFNDAFAVTPGTPAVAGSLRLRVKSNVVSNVLGPSVAPVGTDLGQILSPGVASARQLPGTFGVVWTRFSVCANVDGSTPDSYLDIDFGNGEGAADPIAFIFNETGNIVYQSDDTDNTNALPIFSFGNPGPRAPYTANSGTYTGQTAPSIGIGNYWLATALYPALVLPDAPTAGRWHVRANSGSNLNIESDFYTGISQCGSACSPCVADYNQDGGVDGSDLASFFPEWSLSAPCADVNQDGGVDGGDLETFFVAWQSGSC